MATARMAGTAPPPNCRRTSNTLAPILYFGNRPRRGSDASEPVVQRSEGRACHSSCGILQDMGGETSSVENSRPCAGFARRRFAGWEAQKQRIVLVRRALRCSAGRVMRRKHVTHPVMFDDLVGDPGHPSLLKCPALADRSPRRVFPNAQRRPRCAAGFRANPDATRQAHFCLVMRRGGQRTQARCPPWDMPLIRPPSNSLPTLCRSSDQPRRRR
jgi:hypothetical protein